MESLARVHHRHRPLPLPLHYRGSSLTSRPTSLVWFRALSPSIALSSSSAFKSPSMTIRAPPSSSQSYSLPVSQSPSPRIIQTLSLSASTVIKTTCITIAAAAIFFMRIQLRPALAVRVAPETVKTAKDVSNEVKERRTEEQLVNDHTRVSVAPEAEEGKKTEDQLAKDPTGIFVAVETVKATDNVPKGEDERKFEEQLAHDPSDIKNLRSLLEFKIKAGKLGEAIGILDRCIELDPNEHDWGLLKGHMYMQMGENEMAKQVFEEILKKDHYRVEAYHGLVMVAFDAKEPLQDLLKQIHEAMEVCKKQKRTSDVRDFKLLLAQIKVMDGDYTEALKAYQVLVKEEPRDFRPYLCQGIIYTILRKKNEADAQFEKFRSLFPKNHPYKEYFEGDVLATKFFAERYEKETAGSMS